MPWAYAAVAYAALGRLGEASALISELCAENQFYRLLVLREILPFANPADLEFILENPERVGLPE